MNEPQNQGKNLLTIPYIVHEAAQARADRAIRRKDITIIIIIVISIVSLFLTAYLIDKGWRDYFSECDISNYEYAQDGKGVNIVGDSNGVDYNGETSENQKDYAKEGNGEEKSR